MSWNAASITHSTWILSKFNHREYRITSYKKHEITTSPYIFKFITQPYVLNNLDTAIKHSIKTYVAPTRGFALIERKVHVACTHSYAKASCKYISRKHWHMCTCRTWVKLQCGHSSKTISTWLMRSAGCARAPTDIYANDCSRTKQIEKKLKA